MVLPVVHWPNGISLFAAERNVAGSFSRSSVGHCALAKVAANSLQRSPGIILAPWSQKAGGRGRRGGKTIGGGDMPIEDDDRPRKKISHEIGQDLSLLSVEELTERIALLSSEIERLQAAAAKKRASKDVANSIFKS